LYWLGGTGLVDILLSTRSVAGGGHAILQLCAQLCGRVGLELPGGLETVTIRGDLPTLRQSSLQAGLDVGYASILLLELVHEAFDIVGPLQEREPCIQLLIASIAGHGLLLEPLHFDGKLLYLLRGRRVVCLQLGNVIGC
jgi:hypothetical protein